MRREAVTVRHRYASQMRKKPVSVRVIMQIEELEDGSFYATFPQIGCILVQEETEKDAYYAALEALDMYIEMSIRNDDPIPDEILIHEEPKTNKKEKRKWLDAEIGMSGTYA